MTETEPLFNVFLHFRKVAPLIQAGSVAEALEVAVQITHLEPFKVTDQQGKVLLDEGELKAKILEIGGTR